MTAGTPEVAELPRWLATGIAVLGLLAIGSGMRAPAPHATPTAVIEAADSTFPPFRGFMVDSLRRGRLRAERLAALPKNRDARRPAAVAPDSTRRRNPSRSCMPD